MSDVIHNERTKLLANALDRASTTCFAIGGVGPVVAAGFGVNFLNAAIAAAVWLLVAIVLHWYARIVLGRLRG